MYYLFFYDVRFDFWVPIRTPYLSSYNSFIFIFLLVAIFWVVLRRRKIFHSLCRSLKVSLPHSSQVMCEQTFRLVFADWMNRWSVIIEANQFLYKSPRKWSFHFSWLGGVYVAPSMPCCLLQTACDHLEIFNSLRPNVSALSSVTSYEYFNYNNKNKFLLEILMLCFWYFERVMSLSFISTQMTAVFIQ